MTTSPVSAERTDLGAWLRIGAAGGIVAGIVFALFEMVAALVLAGADAFFMPLRMIGGIGLGPEAMDPGTSPLVAAGVGLAIHMALSVVYGVVIGGVIGLVPQLRTSRATLLVTTSAAGFLLWLVNFYGFAPAFGWTWFPNETDPVVQIVAHTLFYGTALGIVIDRLARPRPA